MKNLFSIVFLAAVVLIATSCKKDAPHLLAGTTWKASITDSEYSWEDTYVFQTNSTGIETYEDTDGDNGTWTFTYTYDHPVIAFYFVDFDGEYAEAAFVSGNAFIMNGNVYKKQ